MKKLRIILLVFAICALAALGIYGGRQYTRKAQAERLTEMEAALEGKYFYTSPNDYDRYNCVKFAERKKTALFFNTHEIGLAMSGAGDVDDPPADMKLPYTVERVSDDELIIHFPDARDIRMRIVFNTAEDWPVMTAIGDDLTIRDAQAFYEDEVYSYDLKRLASEQEKLDEDPEAYIEGKRKEWVKQTRKEKEESEASRRALERWLKDKESSADSSPSGSGASESSSTSESDASESSTSSGGSGGSPAITAPQTPSYSGGSGSSGSTGSGSTGNSGSTGSGGSTKSSSANTNTHDDPYDVYDYGDPEEFYEDYADDFEDEEDAEDYYDEAWDAY